MGEPERISDILSSIICEAGRWEEGATHLKSYPSGTCETSYVYIDWLHLATQSWSRIWIPYKRLSRSCWQVPPPDWLAFSRLLGIWSWRRWVLAMVRTCLRLGHLLVICGTHFLYVYRCINIYIYWYMIHSTYLSIYMYICMYIYTYRSGSTANCSIYRENDVHMHIYIHIYIHIVLVILPTLFRSDGLWAWCWALLQLFALT